MNFSRIEKAWFLLSIATLAFVYGFASHAWGWFPKSQLQQAWRQASRFVNTHQGIGPKTYTRQGVQIPRPKAYQSGTTLITSSWWQDGRWKNGLRLIDKNGTILHEWLVDADDLFSEDHSYKGRNPHLADVHGSYLLPNGEVIVNLTYVGTARLNSCGDVVWSLGNGGHHSISRTENGTFWVSSVSEKKKTQTKNFPNGFPGLKKPVWIDRLVEVSENGNILNDISVINVMYKNGLDRYIPKYSSWDHDVTHLNDVEEIPSRLTKQYPIFNKGDLLVSLHHVNIVFVLDPRTKKVKWHSDDFFIAQHDPDFLKSGWIGIFDNNTDHSNGEMLGGSRIVAVQPDTDSTKILFEPSRLDRFYTPIRGKWQMLENGNMLLTEAEAGRVVEVSPQGQMIWEWVHPGHNSQVPSVTKATRHDIKSSQIASWPCSSIKSSVNNPTTHHTQ